MRQRNNRWRAFGLATFFAASWALAAPSPERIAFCESCHGAGGNSTTPGMPSLAGQPVTFLENQLVFFREGLRHAPVMQPIAKSMKDEEITELARYFAARKPVVAPAAAAPDPALMEKGAQLAQRLHCGQCHLPTFEGRAQMPRLAGQRMDYLVEAMVGYRDAKRTGADTTMTEILQGLSDDDIRALALYTSRLR